jgi:type IV pilus assembly protein PilW
MKRCLSSMSGPQRNTGLSLIELMVALTLGLLIVGAVIQVFVASRLTYNVNEGLGRVQENARFAMEFLQRDVRMAGSSAMCGGRPPQQVNKARDNATIPEIVTLLNPEIAVRGWEYAGTATGTFVFDPPTPLDDDAGNWSDGSSNLPVFLRDRALPGSDVLGLRVFELADPEITGCSGNTVNNFNISTCSRSGGASIQHGVQQGDLWAVVDCQVALSEVCRQTAAGNATTLNCANGGGNVRPVGDNWRIAYQSEMELYLPRATFYYVGQNPAGRRALFRASNCAGTGGGDGCRVEELVEGVDSLQLFYRVAGDNTLFAANALPGNDWGAVRGVVVHLIVSTPDEVDGRQLAQDLVLDNLLIFRTTDRRVRQAYAATIAIRNSLEVF